MTNESLTEQIIGAFGEKIYKKSLNFPNKILNIINFREKPIKINAIILDNEREFHLIINQKKSEIFHDCPSFLIPSEREKKICVHLIKLLLSIKKIIAIEILTNLQNYELTSEDYGSKKKSKNFLLLSNNCFESNNCVEGLNYLNKAIINQSECDEIIEKYLQSAIENNLYLEFFDFLKTGVENDLNRYFSHYMNYINKGYKNFLNSLSDYTFFNILNIIESLDIIFKYIEFPTIKFEKFKKMINSINFNEKYFSIYFVKKNLEKLVNINPLFRDLIMQDHIEASKRDILKYFLDEIENLVIIDKLKLMKKHFEIIGIPKDKFYIEYKRYKSEIKELERKIYLKKFAFLKLLMEKYNIVVTKGEFSKKRNTYIIKHDKENVKNPAYSYLISHIGFYGLENQTIKSTDIGINFFIFKEIFSDNLSNYQDMFYYKNQFWGENEEDLKINSIEGFSLFSEDINYNYDIDQKTSNINDIIIIEWDLANKPRQCSIVNSYGSQVIIPDQNNPLFLDLKPFDLCFCIKNPVKIEGNEKTINVIAKCSIKDAINSITKGMDFIEGYYPLSLVKTVLDKEISPFKANELATNNPNKLFIPNYIQFIRNFREFLFNFINEEKEYIFEEIKSDPEEKANQIIILLNLTNEFTGLDLPFSKIIEKLIQYDIDLNKFKLKLLNEIHLFIKKVLEERDPGSTIIFNLKKMRNTQFFKYSNEIIKIRASEFESVKIIKHLNEKDIWYDVSSIKNTYYGIKISKILNVDFNLPIKPDKYKKLLDYVLKLNLKLNVKESY